MTGEGRAEASADEARRAEEELRAAEQLISADLSRIALTRTYFAAFHAVRAVLFAHGHEPRSHQGALHLFNLHFVKSGTYETATSRLLARLQKFREEADYGEAFVIDRDGAEHELQAAKAFVARTREHLAQS